ATNACSHRAAIPRRPAAAAHAAGRRRRARAGGLRGGRPFGVPGRAACAGPQALLRWHDRRVGGVPGPLGEGGPALRRRDALQLGRRRRHARRDVQVLGRDHGAARVDTAANRAGWLVRDRGRRDRRGDRNGRGQRVPLALYARAAGRRPRLARRHGRLDVPGRRKGHAEPGRDEQVRRSAGRGHALVRAAIVNVAMLRSPVTATPARRRRPFAPLNEPVRDWNGRRVWIVGASSGIGAALARQLAARGARLALSARRPAPLHALLSRTRAQALVLPLDVTDAQAVAGAAARLEAEWGGVDLVLWLAARYAPMRAQDFDLEQAHAIVDANLGGVLNGIAAVLPMLRRQRHGGIALVASVAGYRGLPKSLVYGPTKAALINLAESLYMDLHPENIGVWLVSPGFVDT